MGSPYHGMEYRHYYLAKNLIEKGYKVTLVSGSYSHLFTSPPKINEAFTKEMIDGIEYIWIKVPSYKSSKSLGRIWNMIYFAWKLNFLKYIHPSHILVSSPSLFPVKVAKRFSEKFDTKFLFEVRDIWPLTLMEISNISKNNLLIRVMKYYEKFAYKHADSIISLLPRAQSYYISEGMDRNKFRYLPNGIETKSEDNNILPVTVTSKIPRDKFIVAYSGTVGIANNLDYLLNVAELLKDEIDLHFIVLGQGGEKKRLEEYVETLGLNNFTFLEPVTKEQVGTFLKYIDVAFISLLPEKLFKFGVSPNKVFEYMYAKKPIIWAIEAGNNLVNEAKCGISVPLDDVGKLKESILKLKSVSKEKREELGQNGYTFVKNYHTYAMLAEKLIKIIEE